MLDKKELQQSEPLRVFLVDLVDKNTNNRTTEISKERYTRS